jgi:hypothetical protein
LSPLATVLAVGTLMSYVCRRGGTFCAVLALAPAPDTALNHLQRHT